MHTLIIGIGNELRGDDAVGLTIVRTLSATPSTEWDVCETSDDALTLMETWHGRERVIIVDATQAAGAPGEITRLDPSPGPLNQILNDVSSHGLGLGYSLELARSLAKLPKHCVVFVVEGLDFSMGIGLSPEVEHAIPHAVELIRQELQAE